MLALAVTFEFAAVARHRLAADGAELHWPTTSLSPTSVVAI